MTVLPRHRRNPWRAGPSPRVSGSTARPRRPRTSTSPSSRTRRSAGSPTTRRARCSPCGTVLTVDFTANGQDFVALNGGPEFKFTEAVSFQVFCADQEEIDYYWAKLTENGGEPGPCGWLKDRYGLSWQVVPEGLADMVADPDPEKAARVTKAFMAMGKFDLAALEKAYAGE